MLTFCISYYSLNIFHFKDLKVALVNVCHHISNTSLKNMSFEYKYTKNVALIWENQFKPDEMNWNSFGWVVILLTTFKHIEPIWVECIHRTEFRIIGGRPAKSGEFLGQVRI